MAGTAAPLARKAGAPKSVAPARGPAALQRRLAVGAANDRFEREADRIAERVVSAAPLPAAAPPPVISPLGVQRSPAKPAKQEEEKTGPETPAQRAARPAGPEARKSEEKLEDLLGAAPAQRSTRLAGPETREPEPLPENKEPAAAQREAAPGAAGGSAPAAVEASVARLRQGPAPGLAAPLRGQMEQRLGLDLGNVRVHTSPAAGAAATALNARAFTLGQDVFFAPGQFDPGTTAGRRLIAHETAHTIQQRGGSTAAQRIQRTPKAAGKSEVKEDPAAANTPTSVDKLSGKDWAVDLTAPDGHAGTVTLPKLELPKVAGALKGAAGGETQPQAQAGRSLPAEGAAFKLDPVPARPEGKAFETWLAYAETNFAGPAKTALEAKLAEQKDAAPMARGGNKVYVLYTSGKKAESAKTMLVGTTEQLAKHDSMLRPMLGPKGGDASLDADHILELQLGGLDAAENMWLLQSNYNRSVGASISAKINSSIDGVLENARKELKKTPDAKTPKPLPANATAVRRDWVLRFETVAAGKFGSTQTYWTKNQMKAGAQVKFFEAMTEKDLIQQGFVFKEGEVPSHINVFPGPTGGRIARFKVSGDGTKLEKPSFFYRGIYIIEDAPFKAPSAETKNSVISSIRVRRTKKQSKDSDVIVFADKTIDLKHDENLGFGAYITRDSLVAAFRDVKFGPLSPLTFADVQITPDGELFASGSILSSKALFPELHIPILLRGDEIVVRFPVPTEKLSFGPVRVTEAALNLGVGENGFFIEGEAGIAVDQLGSGRLSAKTTKDDTIIAGKFLFDFNFVEKAEVDAKYSLAKDDFEAKGTLAVKKDSLPGVESGTIEVAATRESFGVTGSLMLGGVLAGSTITVGYMPETGLKIEGKDLPLPVDKLPGVSDAKVTVRALRSPDSGEWAVSGGGKASLAAAGATGTLEIFFDGEAVLLKGRVDVAKGPASGWLDVTATNRATDEAGQPVEGGPVGELKIWGKGEASITFGKVLTGTAGIEYTPEGKVIISGEIALPPTFDLFEKQTYDKPILRVAPPDFPIWGVKLGPVGVGIFAFVDANVTFSAYVGPGQLRDTKVKAVMDLDKPEDATVDGKAQLYVPAYAGFTLDVGGGLKAQAAVAYVKGRVGLDGTLGLGAEGKFDVGVKWNRAEGFEVGATAEIAARPKFEVGVNASVSAGVDLGLFDISKTWGPWRKKLGEFGPDMELSATFPVAWSEKKGLDLDLNKITVKKPSLDAKALMKSAFDTLV